MDLSKSSKFRISDDTRGLITEQIGRLDATSLEFARQTYMDHALNRGVAHFLLDKLPLRSGLAADEKKRQEYAVGVFLGALLFEVAMHQAGLTADMSKMATRPADVAKVALLQEMADGSRFWLQQFFTTSNDVLRILMAEVEGPLRQHGVDIGLPRDVTGRAHVQDDTFIVGVGDALTLSMVQMGYVQTPLTMPLEREVAL